MSPVPFFSLFCWFFSILFTIYHSDRVGVVHISVSTIDAATVDTTIFLSIYSKGRFLCWLSVKMEAINHVVSMIGALNGWFVASKPFFWACHSTLFVKKRKMHFCCCWEGRGDMRPTKRACTLPSLPCFEKGGRDLEGETTSRPSSSNEVTKNTTHIHKYHEDHHPVFKILKRQR